MPLLSEVAGKFVELSCAGYFVTGIDHAIVTHMVVVRCGVKAT